MADVNSGRSSNEAASAVCCVCARMVKDDDAQLERKNDEIKDGKDGAIKPTPIDVYTGVDWST